MAEPSLPLSFPAILRNPAFSKYTYPTQESSASPTHFATRPKSPREHNEGKRWVRRKENARFAGNPHIVTATQRDYSLQASPRSTFPEPLPPFLPRNARLPTSVIPTRDPNTANAGRFSISLKGMRRELRKCGPRAEVLVRDVESEIVNWLQDSGTIFAPDTSGNGGDMESRTPVGGTETIFEVSRTPLQLIWSIADDPFARYVVHCCARYYEIVSFSKEISGQRFTYLLRPNVVYPDHRAPGVLDTPPMTDADYSSQPETESDYGVDSDIEQQSPINLSLLTISENPSSQLTSAILDNEIPLNTGGEDVDSDTGLADGSDVFSMHSHTTAGCTSTFATRFGRQPFMHQVRGESSTFSPSRSPSRMSFHSTLWSFRCHLPHPKDLPQQHQSFYHYLFA